MNANEYPLVSVLILFYNQEKFVEETLNSVLAQDYPYVEIITADDASTDGTVAVIKRYAAAHSNIKPVLSTVNGGITKNCNNALQEATGKYLVFLGGDDLMLPGRITSQVQYFLQHPDISVCCTDIQIFYDGQPHKNFVYRNREFYKKMSPARIIAQDNAPPTAGLMFDFEKCGDIKFDPRTPVVSDWLFVVECCLRGKLGYIEKVYTCYRRHDNNTTLGGLEKSYLQDRLIYTDILISKYPKYKLPYKKQRCNIFYNEAKRHFLASEFKSCRGFLKLSWLEWPFSFRMYALYIASFGGKWLLGKVQNYKGA